MTRAGVIPLSSIERIEIYFNTKKKKSTKSNLQKILQETGGSFITNASIFLRSGKPCCHLKADGKTKCKPNYTAWAIAWNAPSDFAVRVVPDAGYANHMECVHAIIAGKPIDPMNYGKDMGYATHRVAYGMKDGQLAYYATQDNITPEKLRDRLMDIGWSDAIMMDGGGSACFVDKDGDGFVGDGRYIPFFIVVTLKSEVAPVEEPKGENQMVDIYSYSLAKNGSDAPVMSTGQRCTNFKVREFACKDGTDPVFVAPMLALVLQSIRDRIGKSVTITSAYRTPQHNAKEGGVADSQHCYGMAADIVVKGVDPDAVADCARSIMPNWGGVGRYSNFTHIDVRPERADWNG